jgi:RimJ/RimL family protein N-acetyltransferase
MFDAWDQDSETGRTGSWISFPRAPEATRKWAEETAAAVPEDDNFRWMIERLDGTSVGTILTHSCNRRVGTFGYGVTIAREHWRQGYATEAIRIVLRYFFDELRYQKVTVQVYAFNEGSTKLHEQLGFQPEGRLRRMVYTDGQYHDVLVFGMTAEEFREKASAP